MWITVIFFPVLHILWFSHKYTEISNLQITSSNLPSTIHCLMVAVLRLQPFWNMSKQYRKDIDSHLNWKSACFHRVWFYFTLLPLRWNELTARKEIDWNLRIVMQLLAGEFARMGRAYVCCIDNCRMLRKRTCGDKRP